MSRALPARMLRAARLDSSLYEEVEADRRSIRQAVVVVLLASAAGALGAWLAGRTAPRVAAEFVEPFVVWLGGSVFAYMVGATFFRGPDTETDYAEVVRTVGFAYTPGLLRGLAFLPVVELPAVGGIVLGVVIVFAADLWVLAAGIVAVRQALDFTTLRAVGTFGAAYVLLWIQIEGLLLFLAAALA
ncbi:MAG: YIP1 family protein [Deltaproteobacteria bacterium]|nr:MAG: YIP1 family protein [Deltaproteobacteria bacterium]